MPKVKLEVIDPIKGLIKAPDFCPYKKMMSVEYVGKQTTLVPEIYEPVNVVHASICQLCRMCDFVQELDTEVEISEADVDKVRKGILSCQQVVESFSKQYHYLQRNDRIPMAAFLSFGALQEILDSLFTEPYKTKVQNYLVSLESPIICSFSGIPLYFSSKLTKSVVMVVGEITWS